MCSDNPEPCVIGRVFGDDPGDDGALADHDVSAGGGVPRLGFVLHGEASVDEAPGNDVGCMEGGGAVVEEMRVVEGVGGGGVEGESHSSILSLKCGRVFEGGVMLDT